MKRLRITKYYDLNTSNVTVNQIEYKKYLTKYINLNTSNVTVNQFN